MLKFNILNMKEFLDTVNACHGEVRMIYPEGGRENIKNRYRIQCKLSEQYRENKNCLPIMLEVPEPRDYMKLVAYYAGDC